MTRSLHFMGLMCCAAALALLSVGCQNKNTAEQSADQSSASDTDGSVSDSTDAHTADSADTSTSSTAADESGSQAADDHGHDTTAATSAADTSTENPAADTAADSSSDAATATNEAASESATTTDATATDATASDATASDATASDATAENSEAVTKLTPSAVPADEDRATTGDWSMWGGSIHRNMVNASTGVSVDFDVKSGKNIIWTAKLGSQSYGNPVVASGKILVGTNNSGGYRPKHPANEDRGVVLCFEEKTGKFLWQLTRMKLPAGQVNDWPLQGICSSACVEGDRAWVVTNRCELMCLDLEGFYDGENDGTYTEEVDNEEQDADIVWSLDMMDQLGVFPHNLATSSPAVHGDNVYIVTSNGVDEAHLEVPSPRAPSFVCVNKTTGEVVWEDNSPASNILHGQWSSPTICEVNGQVQAIFPGGDGWLYSFNAENGELIWKFDLNPKDAVYELGTRGTRNECIATPVFVENSIVVGVGQDPEHLEGVGHLYRIDATKTGDISAELDEDGDHVGEPNPNSGMIWHYGGVDADGKVTGKPGQYIYRRTISTAAVHDGLVFAADLSGFLHCIDFKTGERYWIDDLLAAVWGSPMVVDGKVLIGDEDGDVAIFEEAREKKPIGKAKEFGSSVYSTPVIANGVMYIMERSKLYAIATQ